MPTRAFGLLICCSFSRGFQGSTHYDTWPVLEQLLEWGADPNAFGRPLAGRRVPAFFGGRCPLRCALSVAVLCMVLWRSWEV